MLASMTTTAGAVTLIGAGSRVSRARDCEHQRGHCSGREEYAARDDAAARSAEPGRRRRLAVPFSRSRGRRRRRAPFELGSLGEDRALEALELRARLQPELAREQPPAVAVGLKRVRLPPTAVQREHPLAPEALAHRVGGHERAELADDFAMAAETKQGLDPVLCRAKPQLLEPLDLGAGEVVEGELCQRRPSPELERLVEHVNGLGLRAVVDCTLCLDDESLEALCVHGDGIGAQRVAGLVCHEEAAAVAGFVFGLQHPA